MIYKIYFDNAAGIKLGAPVMLAGRKIGQVKSLNSPVSREEAGARPRSRRQPRHGRMRRDPGTLPHFEVRIDVEVDRTAVVYKNANVRLMTLGLLGDTAIDISGGNDHSGKSEAGQVFAGNRVPDFSEAVAKMLGIIQPVATQATVTMKELQNTVTNLSKITDDNAPLTLALGQFKIFTEHLNQITAPDSSLSKSLAHIEDLSNQLTKNDNITVTLANFRDSSERIESGPRQHGARSRGHAAQHERFHRHPAQPAVAAHLAEHEKISRGRSDPCTRAQSDPGEIAPHGSVKPRGHWHGPLRRLISKCRRSSGAGFQTSSESAVSRARSSQS